MDSTSLMIGIVVMATATAIGYRMRTISHAIVPIRDPMFLILIIMEMTILTLDASDILSLGWMSYSSDTLTVTDSGATAMMAIAALDVGYVMGYAMCRPGDVVRLDMPGGSAYERSEIVPVVTYIRNGNRYLMPQTISGIILSYMGARHPIDIPLHEVSRVRSYKVSDGGLRRPMEVSGAMVVASHSTEDFTVGLIRIGSRKVRDEYRNIIAESPKYLIHTKVTYHQIRFAWSATEDYQIYQIKTGLYRDAIDDARDAEERAARLEIQIQSLQFDAAADIVAGLISLTKDAPGANDEILAIINRILDTKEVSNADS